jgi:hypothetical protein
VGERPRWRAIAPYLGITAATAGIFGLEALAPAFAAWLGFSGGREFGAAAVDFADAAVTRTASGEFYSVTFETRLNPSSYPGLSRLSRAAHFQEANEALLT